jgi:N-methylhydantoinase A/oxoprolinase/acetone carboxylase beta subunit
MPGTWDTGRPNKSTGGALNSQPGDSLVLGIDTGGTYTDAVLLAYRARQVLAAHKSLTTKRDFSIGIEQVIDGIHIDDPAAVKMVSISTTLATNAIAEGKGKRVALFLIGYDPELIANFRMQGRFATPHFFYFRGGHDLFGREKAELDLPGILAQVNKIKDRIDAIAVSSYFSPLNPEHENRAYNAISSICDLPIVLGHQLSTRLGSVERATTAALNASLLAVLQDFVIAARRAMERRRIEAPLMVVRGDGTLMSDEFAARTPVETIHSGPAASAIGGRFLSNLDEALIVDVGGTTTDLALIEGGQVRVSSEGATVGEYKTSVQAANLLSIALGGDSHIRTARDGRIAVGPERVLPLAHLAHLHPDVARRLKALSQRQWSQATPDWLEYWRLLREPPPGLLENSQQEALVALLAGGPQPVPEILKHLNILHVGQIHVAELMRQEIIGKAGLTPTDLMHVEGSYAPWDVGSATLALQVFSRHVYATGPAQRDPAEVRRRIWERLTEMAVHAIVTFLTGKQLPPPGAIDHEREASIGPWFLHNSLYRVHPHLATEFHLKIPIIGIGAAAGLFLKPVAEALHAELVLPTHHEVANAVGAVAGSVMVSEEVLVYPRLDEAGLKVLGYYVQTGDRRSEFDDVAEALAQASGLAHERALGGALRSGADNPQVMVEQLTGGLDTYRVRARAMGNPRLAH